MLSPMNDESALSKRSDATTEPVRKLTWPTLKLLFGRGTLMWLGLGFIFSLVLAGVELSISVFLQLFLKSIGILGKEVGNMTWIQGVDLTPKMLALSLCVIGLVRAVSYFLVGQSGNIAMEGITLRLRRIAVFDMLLHPSRHFVSAAVMNARIGDFFIRASLFAYALAVLLGAGVQAMALIVVMAVAAPKETLIGMIGLALVGVLVVRVNRYNRRSAAQVPRELSLLTEGIERIARNMVLVRTLRTEKLEQFQLSRAIDNYRAHSLRAGYLGNLATAMTPFAGILVILVVVASSQSYFHTSSVTLLSFLYLFVRFVQTLSQGAQQFSTCNSLSPQFFSSYEFVDGFTRDQVEAAMAVVSPPVLEDSNASSSQVQPPAIHVRDVSYTYPGSDRPAVSSFSLDIPAKSQCAIVGPSGCGKSTLLSLILGLIEPTGGSIDVEGETPRSYFGRRDVRIGYVGAEAFLIAGTIRENLKYGASGTTTDNDLWAALEQARLAEAVRQIPAGLDYLIAEDGSGLSAGQKQRLCLARALLNRPHVLVLDEASANLDVDTELEIAETIKDLRGVCTTIIVSHRRGLLKYADHVVDLQR